MKKRLLTMLTLCSCAVLLASCRASADTRTGQADGYGGILRVQVMMEDGAISAVNILEQHETDGIGSRALDILPDEMIRMNTWDVDVVTGATMTSNALREAVRVALNASDTMDEATGNPANRAGQAIREGIGMAATGRVGPGKDDEDGQVYSFNVVFAHGTFDEDGRIVGGRAIVAEWHTSAKWQRRITAARPCRSSAAFRDRAAIRSGMTAPGRSSATPRTARTTTCRKLPHGRASAPVERITS